MTNNEIKNLLYEFWQRSSDACPLEVSEAEKQEKEFAEFVESKLSAGQGSEGVVTIEQIVQECDRRYPIVDEEIFDDTYRSYHEYTEAQSELRKAFDEGADFVISHQPLPVSPSKPTSEELQKWYIEWLKINFVKETDIRFYVVKLLTDLINQK